MFVWGASEKCDNIEVKHTYDSKKQALKMLAFINKFTESESKVEEKEVVIEERKVIKENVKDSFSDTHQKETECPLKKLINKIEGKHPYELINNQLLVNCDCKDIMPLINKGQIKLVFSDPPYDIKNTKAGGKSNFAKSIQNMNDEILEVGITKGFDYDVILKQMLETQDKINMYIWCNKAQIPFYLNYFVSQRKCSFDLIKWVKTNPMPTFYNKYLSDTEYCLYIRKGGRCMPNSFEDGSTLYQAPINIKDKRLYGHPTIKPLDITRRIIRNSSEIGDIILDPFSGVATTSVACIQEKRKSISIEINEKFYKTGIERVRREGV